MDTENTDNILMNTNEKWMQIQELERDVACVKDWRLFRGLEGGTNPYNYKPHGYEETINIDMDIELEFERTLRG